MTVHTFEDLYRDAERHDDYWAAQASLAFTEDVCAVMEEKKISRTELARRLGTSPAYVTKLLRGDTNFTLATLVKVARALGAELEVRLHADSHREQPAAQETSGEVVPRSAAV